MKREPTFSYLINPVHFFFFLWKNPILRLNLKIEMILLIRERVADHLKVRREREIVRESYKG